MVPAINHQQLLAEMPGGMDCSANAPILRKAAIGMAPNIMIGDLSVRNRLARNNESQLPEMGIDIVQWNCFLGIGVAENLMIAGQPKRITGSRVKTQFEG